MDWTDCWDAATSRCSEYHTTRAFYPLELTVISTFAPVPHEPTNAHTASILHHAPCCCVQEKWRMSECECRELNIQCTPPVNQSWCQPGNITNMPDPALFPLCSSRFFPFLPLFQVPTPLNVSADVLFPLPRKALPMTTLAFSHIPNAYLFIAPEAGKSNLFLHSGGKRVKLDQVLTGLSLSLSDVSTGDVSLQGQKEAMRERERSPRAAFLRLL